MAKEAVEHPPHYGGEGDPYETIKVLANKLTPEEFAGFCKGNASRYLDRTGKNGPAKTVEDLRKAAWYATYLADYLEGKK